MEPSSTLHRLRPYRSSNRIDRRAAHGRCMRVPPRPTTLGGRDNWTTADRRLSPYRPRASPKRKLPAFSNFARPAIARTRQANHNYYKAIALYATNTQELMIVNAPPYPAILLRVGSRGQGYAERHGSLGRRPVKTLMSIIPLRNHLKSWRNRRG
jgi:hypothetical protein